LARQVIGRQCQIILLLLGLIGCSGTSAEQDAETAQRSLHYEQWDVFTDVALAGNQLAVFTASEGLSADLMQKIAREMAFSETSFVFPAKEVDHDAVVRIFSPKRELSFAGHPTIGTAFALARTGHIVPGEKHAVFAEGIGPVIVKLEWEAGELRFAWMYQRDPVFGKPIDDTAGIAAALGIQPTQLISPALPVQEVSCGSSYIMMPVASRAAVDQATIDSAALAKIVDRAGTSRRSFLVFSMEPAGDGATVYSRMLRFDGSEDPATGGASGPLGSYLVHHGLVSAENASDIVSRQGVQMGRPSRIHVRIGTQGEEIVEVLVGGTAVYIGEGTLLIPNN
jgi:trans-2,3-dihydro-3-hydroxyanthranilate isomerase